MRLGPKNPEWVALRRALATLASRISAQNVFVIDAWSNLWCSARPASEDELLAVIGVAERILSAQEPRLQRGGRIDRMINPALAHGYVRSFGSAYILLVLFEVALESTMEMRTRGAVARALPRIEALTIALPPPDGPGTGSAEGFGKA